ncbi:uncharacterized protein K452DRAFT_306284 [Aplosporella prunicola CBS 121167]|uniref:GST N-terminal domain-containing protein n=1 Tax=Aplosporella prunicola CBS 121167 TaxID=1176127 RepID=A0A6A6BNN4_9PEZI|nr:uncharacterized protein K452DRAFT_306284 [Aplosporella prunicola CBS 121167]KAF2144447.1 hypothetical protein K452DRAFT_306284 [Aplosporella prunicola CBS 121167]
MTQEHPDIYPEATGLAKATVQVHQAETPLKLYGGWFCPFVQRIWLILEEKGIPYQFIEVNPYNRPESLLRLNPRGLTPALEYNKKPLYESTVIAEFLDEAYLEHMPRLYPEDLYEKARSKIWIDYVTSRIVPAWFRFLQYQPTQGEDGLEGLKKVQQEFLGYLREWTKEMDQEGPYFLGAEPTMADLTLGPFVVRCWLLDHFKGGSGIPKEGEAGDDELWRRWRKYAEALATRKSVKETTSEPDKYLSFYKWYAGGAAHSELAKATRAGRGLP